jgi:RNA recognition motif-containing protein
MGQKLYVGNLPFSATDDSVHELFSTIGTVQSAKVIMDRDTGRSKGFAFVEMSTPEEAQTAIQKLNQTNVGDRSINVSEARPQESRSGGGGGGGGGGRSGGHRGW